MKILVYADFRSPHALGIRSGLMAAGHDVLAVSSEIVEVADIRSPQDFLARARNRGAIRSHAEGRSVGANTSRVLANFTSLHTLLNLARYPARRRLLRRALHEFQPDLVHALRVPYEGVTALSAVRSVPVAISTWGLDFEPMARVDPLLRLWLRFTLFRASGIHTDNPMDQERAVSFGLRPEVPHIYAAGNFGIDTELFYGGETKEKALIVLPRRPVPGTNYRGFVRAVLALSTDFEFRAVGVGLLEVERELVAEFGESLKSRIELTDRMSRVNFAQLLRKADIVVSPSYWDGTPNTVIEAHVCGCRLIVGALDQFTPLREKGVAMELIDPRDWREIHRALVNALVQTREPQLSEPQLPKEFDRIENESRFTSFYEEVLRAL